MSGEIKGTVWIQGRECGLKLAVWAEKAADKTERRHSQRRATFRERVWSWSVTTAFQRRSKRQRGSVARESGDRVLFIVGKVWGLDGGQNVGRMWAGCGRAEGRESGLDARRVAKRRNAGDSGGLCGEPLFHGVVAVQERHRLFRGDFPGKKGRQGFYKLTVLRGDCISSAFGFAV